jgi:hypothetical protein
MQSLEQAPDAALENMQVCCPICELPVALEGAMPGACDPVFLLFGFVAVAEVSMPSITHIFYCVRLARQGSPDVLGNRAIASHSGALPPSLL